MKCRQNVRKLIQEYNAASPAGKPTTALIKFRNAVVALKTAPSRLPAPHTQANRYDDYVYIHQQSMADDPAHPMPAEGPHPGHRGPMFFPWHREFLRQFERDLRDVVNDQDICLPYWDWSTDQSAANPGYPFFEEFLGGNGTGAGIVVGGTTVFSTANGWTMALADTFDANPSHQASVNSLQRQFNGASPSLPPRNDVIASLAISTYDSDPWDLTVTGNSSFRNKVEGWPAAFGALGGSFMHNRVHVGVGGSMLPSTSPNDPVFFLNHAKEDELWAVWMQKYPAVPHYLPPDGISISPAIHHLKRLSDHMDSLAEYFGPGTIDRPIDLLDHKAITWYDTDLPDISLESGPAVAFTNTPAGLTVSKRIRFRIKSCRQVFFTMTGAPTGNFSVVGGPGFPSVTPIEANDSEVLEVEVRFIGQGPAVQVSALDIQAHILDEEGYYAANANDPFVVKTFHIELVANNIVTSDSSIVLVLDRSGSMGDVANSGFTKSQLLKSAVGIVHQLMKDSDQLGISRFDHESDVLLPMTPQSAGLGTILTGTGLDPRGSTNIAGGILVGSGLLNGPGATHANKAMVVLTDGNDYPVKNTIATLPPGTINQTTFAIGFGTPGQVNDATLSQISTNTGGYLLTTGNMTNSDERFRLAKFFIQILKDATLNQTVVDPEGQLLWNGQPQEIAFQVADSDVSIDVVALCPIPFALDFQIVTPGGQTITPAMSGVEPNVRYHVGADVAYYRLMLPALPSQPGDSHRGTWRALLALRPPSGVAADIRALTHDNRTQLAEMLQRLREFASKPTPYNVTVHSYSNLAMDATLTQKGFAPGDAVTLNASLWEYRSPLRVPARVWADLTEPNGAQARLALVPGGPGAYAAAITTSRPGVYQFAIHAEGETTAGARFTREKLLTAGVWAGGDRPFDPVGGGSGGAANSGDDAMCKTVLCVIDQVLRSERLMERFKAMDIDLVGLRRCLEGHCAKDATGGERPEAATSARADIWTAVAQHPEWQRMMVALAQAPAALFDEGLLEAAKTRPVRLKPRLPGVPGNMFVLEDDNGAGLREEGHGHDEETHDSGDHGNRDGGNKKRKR